jgi:hypothetical protein
MTNIPNLAGVVTQDLVEHIGTGKFAAAYVNWSRTMALLREHAPGWQPELVHAPDGYILHQAPVGGYLMIRFRNGDRVTPPVPQAIMDNRNAAIPLEKHHRPRHYRHAPPWGVHGRCVHVRAGLRAVGEAAAGVWLRGQQNRIKRRLTLHPSCGQSQQALQSMDVLKTQLRPPQWQMLAGQITTGPSRQKRHTTPAKHQLAQEPIEETT